MAGSSSSISFILNKAAASNFLQTTAPPTTKHPQLFRINTVLQSTLLNLANDTSSNYISMHNKSNLTSNVNHVNELESVAQQQNGTIYKSSEVDSYIDGNFSNLNTSEGYMLNESWWNVFDEKYLRHSMAWTITLIVAYMLILIVGVIGNFMVILVISLRPQMRSVTNMFIMNLAVADLFVIVFCVPATLLSNIFTRKSEKKLIS